MVRPLSRQGVPVLKRASSKPHDARLSLSDSAAAVAGPAAARLGLAGVHDRLEERAGGQHDGLRPIERLAAGHARRRRLRRSAVARHSSSSNAFDHLLAQRQVRLRLDGVLHRELVELLVRLGARRVHGRPLGAVEHAELDGAWRRCTLPISPPRASISRTICPLATPPMAGLQLIWADGVGVHGQQGGAQPQAGGGEGRFDPGMAGADDDDVELVGQREHGSAPVRHTGRALDGIYPKRAVWKKTDWRRVRLWK